MFGAEQHERSAPNILPTPYSLVFPILGTFTPVFGTERDPCSAPNEEIIMTVDEQRAYLEHTLRKAPEGSARRIWAAAQLAQLSPNSKPVIARRRSAEVISTGGTS